MIGMRKLTRDFFNLSNLNGFHCAGKFIEIYTHFFFFFYRFDIFLIELNIENTHTMFLGDKD